MFTLNKIWFLLVFTESFWQYCLPTHFRMTYRTCDVMSTCVEIYQCPGYGNLLVKNIPGKITMRARVPKHLSCGMQQKYNNMICCPNTALLLANRQDTIADPVAVPFTNSPTETSSEANEKTPDANSVNYWDICGVIPSKFRIMSGNATDPGEFPWMALIAYKTDKSNVFRCGATIIDEWFVLTAAHCVDSTLSGIRLGEHNLETKEDCDSRGQNCQPPAEDFLVDQLIPHPDYNSSTYLNDIALIKLKTPANFRSSNIKPICLPLGELDGFDLTERNVTVTGWGGTENGAISAILRKVDLPVMSFERCRRLYKRIKPVTTSQICAGAYKGHDSCAGDSGGPLQFPANIKGSSRYIQYGIVSYGPKICGIDDLPGIYTDVRPYLHWIFDVLKSSLTKKE